MKLASDSIVVNAPRDIVWQVLLHWQNWPSWDIAMESVSFDGPIDVGSQGRLKINGGPAVILHVDAVNEGESYTDHFKLLGTKYIFAHVITDLGSGAVSVRFDVDAEGPTSFIFGSLSRARIATLLPRVLENLKAYLALQS
jgi:hypothetical protein